MLPKFYDGVYFRGAILRNIIRYIVNLAKANPWYVSSMTRLVHTYLRLFNYDKML